MRLLDKARKFLTGQVVVDVPDNLSIEDEADYVANELHQRGFEVRDTTSMTCTRCNKWILVNEYINHFC